MSKGVPGAGRLAWVLGACCLLAGPAGAEEAVAPSVDPGQVIEQQLARGKELLRNEAYPEAQAAFSAVLQIDPTHREALKLLTRTQSRLDDQRAREAREWKRLRDRAQDLAIRFAREKQQERARETVEAERQVAGAREQRLKFLYNRGVVLYQEGAYEAAIAALRQMVLLDPTHPLVDAGQRLIVQAEARMIGQGAGPPASDGADLTELERQLAAKKITIETNLKFAKHALKQREYDQTIEAAQRVLTEDPEHREAHALLVRAQEGKVADERERLERLVGLDEHEMINDVVRAQRVPQARQVTLPAPAATDAARRAMSDRLAQPISLAFEEVPLGDVLSFIGDAASVSIIPSPQLDLAERRVSLNVQELPLELAVKYLAKSQGLSYRVEGDVILIASAEEFASEPMETRVFFLRHGVGPIALETSAVQPNAMLTLEPLRRFIGQVVPEVPESKLIFDERSGALIVTNTRENLELIARVLSELDVTPLQVLIEARFIELTMTEFEQFAFESVLTEPLRLKQGSVAGGSPGAGHVVAKDGGSKFPALSRESEGLNLTLEGVLTATKFEAVLHMLEETRKSKTLSSPRVTTLNNQTAIIRVVDEFRYPTKYEVSLVQFDVNGDGDFDDAGETEFVNVPSDFQKRDVGILLSVTPSVGQDGKTITLILAPEVSGFSQFRDLGGGVVVPEFTSSQLTTSVAIEDGQTVVLGGLMKDTTAETVTKVPVLGDLPMVGSLFRQRKDSSTRKNLLIFITARLLAPRGPKT